MLKDYVQIMIHDKEANTTRPINYEVFVDWYMENMILPKIEIFIKWLRGKNTQPLWISEGLTEASFLVDLIDLHFSVKKINYGAIQHYENGKRIFFSEKYPEEAIPVVLKDDYSINKRIIKHIPDFLFAVKYPHLVKEIIR